MNVATFLRGITTLVLFATAVLVVGGTTAADAPTYAYDAPIIARTHVQEINAADARSVLLSVAKEESARPLAEARGTSTTSSRSVVATESDYVNLASESRTSHILDGEVRPNGTYGGGHRPGTGFPNKSEFPAGWSDDQIMHNISDVATDPALPWTPGDRPGDFLVNGTRSNVDIEVLIRNDQIWTGYPTNLPRNPR